ncbi:MAG: hypothetical protein AB7F23_01850 [Phycisphaerae bacterium]|jgi:hypothetical protein
MKTKIYLILLVAFAGALFAADQYSEQLRLYKSALISSAEEQMRLSAAKQILVCPSQESVEVIGQVLSGADINGQMAVFKAMISRSLWETPISNADKYALILVDYLKSAKLQQARLACEALSSFDYSVYSEQLKQMLLDEKTAKTARLNYLMALSYNLTEKDAIATIITLLDDSDSDIATAASRALQTWVPIGNDKKLWQQFLEELNKKTPEEIVRDRLAMQEQRVKLLEQKNRSLEDELIASLDSFYDSSKADDARAAIIKEKLSSVNSAVSLWAVKKTKLWRSNAELPEQIKEKLKSLISSDSASVRLEIAQLMVFLADSDPSRELYAQLQKETYPTIKLALFNALTETCYYGLVQSGKTIDPEIRTYQLNMATALLESGTSEEALSAVDAIRKLLDRNGIEDSVVEPYYAAVLKRLSTALAAKDGSAADIIKKITGMFSPNAHYRAIAARLLTPEITKALDSEDNSVVLAAIGCLEVINKSDAMSIVRAKKLYERSDELYKKSLTMAAEAGGADDLVWIEERLRASADKNALDALIKLMELADSTVSDMVVAHFQSYNITDESKLSLLETAMKKNNLSTASLSVAANAWYSRGKVSLAADCFSKLLARGALSDKEYVRALDIFTKNADFKGAALVVALLLTKQDIAADSEPGKLISTLTASPEVGAAFKEELLKITAAERPLWTAFAQQFKPQQTPAPAAEPEKPAAVQENKE